MRVSLTNVHLFGRDAVAQCLVAQARALLRRGHEVAVYSALPPRDVPPDVAAVTRVVDLAAALADRHFTSSDLHVFHYPGLHPLLEAIPSLRGRIVLHYHNVTPPELWGSDHERDLLVRSRASVRRFAEQSHLVVTESPFNVADLVGSHGADPARIRLVPLGVDLARFQPGPPDPALAAQYGLAGRPIVLFVGRLAGNKRVDLLVDALPLVQAQVPGAALLVVGDQESNPAFVENAAALRDRAARRGIAGSVVFAGSVECLPPYYRAATVYATASLHEGFAVPLLEAMASGLPLVASRAAAHPWVVAGAGLLTEAGDAGALAAALVRVITDEALRVSLRDRGLARARELSLDAFEARWLQCLADVSAAPAKPVPTEDAPVAEAPPAAPAVHARCSDGIEVVALIAAYNEEDVVGEVVQALIEDGVRVYFIDNHSTDRTLEIVRSFAGRGLIGIESFPPGAPAPPTFEWERILRRKEALAREIDADWFIHHDADEFRESPWPAESLTEGIRRVDLLGYNAIDFSVLEFRPSTADPPGASGVRARLQYYQPGNAFDRVQVKCWKRTGYPVALAPSGGHEAEFHDRRVFPIRFLLRHYPIRSQEHGERKVFTERRPRFQAHELLKGWHVQYDDIPRGAAFVRDPATLVRYDAEAVRLQMLRRHREFEEAERAGAAERQAASRLSAETQGLRRHLAVQDEELERLRLERAAVLSDAEGLRRHLAVQDEELERLRLERAAVLSDAEGLRRHLAVQDEELERLRLERAGLLSDAEGLRRHLAVQDEELERLRLERAGLLSDAEGLRRSLEAQAEELANLKPERRRLLSDLEEARGQLASQSQVLDAARARLAAVLASASWRLTSPLRTLGDRFLPR